MKIQLFDTLYGQISSNFGTKIQTCQKVKFWQNWFFFTKIRLLEQCVNLKRGNWVFYLRDFTCWMDVLSSFCNEYVFFLFRWKVSELIINGVQRQDDGLYECQARNEGGQFFKSGHIQVGNNNNKFLLGLPYPKKMSYFPYWNVPLPTTAARFFFTTEGDKWRVSKTKAAVAVLSEARCC